MPLRPLPRSLLPLATLLAGLCVGRLSHRVLPPPSRAVTPLPTSLLGPPRPARSPEARASLSPLRTVAPAPDPPRTFRLDARRTGRSGYVLPASLGVLAHAITGARISTQPVLARDGALLITSHDGRLHAFDPATLAQRWTFPTGDRIYTTPVVLADGTIAFGTDADHFVTLDARGHLDLALVTTDDADTSAAVAPDGTMRFAAGNELYSTTADLTVLWRTTFASKVFASPAIAPDGTTVVGCQDDHVYAFDGRGTLHWSVATGGDVDATPAIDDDGTTYVGGDDGAVVAITHDGVVKWRHDVHGFVRTGAALGLDGTIVVGVHGPRPRVVGLAMDDGSERFTIPLGGPRVEEWGVTSSALVDREGRYAIGLPDGRVVVLDRDGTVRAEVMLPARVQSSPALVADGVLAVGCDDGGVYLLGVR